MSVILRMAVRRLGAGVMLGMVSCLASARDVAVNSELVLTSIDVRGTNLTLVAVVPAGLGQVTLENRPALNAAWKPAGALDVPAGGGAVT